jgi:hypothetical protein
MQIVSSTVPFENNLGLWSAQIDLHRDLIIEVVFGPK